MIVLILNATFFSNNSDRPGGMGSSSSVAGNDGNAAALMSLLQEFIDWILDPKSAVPDVKEEEFKNLKSSQKEKLKTEREAAQDCRLALLYYLINVCEQVVEFA